tara:strand:+ start:386 stop:628 length:243 start_codon:yes stop_codon:yes gene_type:complete
MFPSDELQNIAELATSVEQYFPTEPEKALEEFISWGKGSIIATIAFNIVWEYLSMQRMRDNPMSVTRPIRFSDFNKPSLN